MEWKRVAIGHYGGQCAVCALNELGLLVLDHVDDDGAEHRKLTGGGGHKTYRWTIEHAFPPIFQVLCHNHNAKKEAERYRALYPTVSAVARRRHARRRRVVLHYGGCCANCSEQDYDVLQFDHIGGGGRRHLTTIPGRSIPRWLIRNNMPPGFQLLCANCNYAKSHLTSVP